MLMSHLGTVSQAGRPGFMLGLFAWRGSCTVFGHSKNFLTALCDVLGLGGKLTILGEKLNHLGGAPLLK